MRPQQVRPDSGAVLTGPEGALIPLFGASLLSSVGSLPLHLAPLIVTTLISDSRASLAAAGWVPSALLLGQLSTSLALPALGIHNVRRSLAIVTAAILLTGLAISSRDSFENLLLGWFLVGQSCGVLMYLGTIEASRFPRPTFAFSLRLAVVLILAGAIASLLQVSNAFASYRSLLIELAPIVALILVCGILLHRPVEADRANTTSEGGRWTFRQVSGLATVFFFFVGQTGFLAYVVQQALDRGMSFADTAWSMVGMKFAAGVWLLAVAVFEFSKMQKARFLYLSVLLTAGILTVFFSRSVAVFFLGLVLYEITLNTLSARLQSAVVAARPQFAGPWLTGVILLGAAIGPPLNGLAIGMGLQSAFILVSVLAALGPLLWQQCDRSAAQVEKVT